jgi:hypothetical protein
MAESVEEEERIIIADKETVLVLHFSTHAQLHQLHCGISVEGASIRIMWAGHEACH